jgi:uncharacterized protein YybS (DUF2232 family)
VAKQGNRAAFVPNKKSLLRLVTYLFVVAVIRKQVELKEKCYRRVSVAATISLAWAVKALLKSGLNLRELKPSLVEINIYSPGGNIKPSRVSR